MPSLRELQCGFRRSLVALQDDATAMYVVGDGLTPDQRVAVYRNTFDGNLSNAMRLSYPAIHRLVGGEFFAGATRIFAHQHPPRSACLDEYGAGFPGFLAHFPPAATLAYLPDVAQLEWAVSQALHAPDVAPLEAQRLAQLDPADHERICFVAAPSLALVRSTYPVDMIWRAVLAQDDRALGAVDLAAGPVWLLIERLATGVEIARIDERTWHFSAALFAGRSLGGVLENSMDPETSTWLAEHIAAGRFVAFSLAERTADQTAPELVS